MLVERPAVKRQCVNVAGGMQGASAMGTDREAYILATAHRGQTGNIVPGDKRLHIIHITDRQAADRGDVFCFLLIC